MVSTYSSRTGLAILWIFLFLPCSLGHTRDVHPEAVTNSISADNSNAFQSQSEKNSSNERPEPELLENGIHLAAGYLARACLASGKFNYRMNLNPHVKVDSGYNLLRHAGAIYALASYARRYSDSNVHEPINRAVKYLKQNIKEPLYGRDDIRALWSEEENDGAAKLGGTGLALVALLSVEKIMPGTTSREDLRRLARFLLYMQKDDGSFYSKFMRGSGSRNDAWTSLYYPGEAALGLLMLYDADPVPEWLYGAAKAISFLAQTRKGKKVVEADHWALLATAKLLPLYELCRAPLPREEILGHAAQICESILSSMPLYTSDMPECGSLTPNGMTCQTATRLEGLLASLSFLPDSQADLRRRISTVSMAGIAFLLRAQVVMGDNAGAMPRALRPLPEKHPGFSKKFNRRATEVRIDYVQHALCSMLQFTALSSQFPAVRQAGSVRGPYRKISSSNAEAVKP